MQGLFDLGVGLVDSSTKRKFVAFEHRSESDNIIKMEVNYRQA